MAECSAIFCIDEYTRMGETRYILTLERDEMSRLTNKISYSFRNESKTWNANYDFHCLDEILSEEVFAWLQTLSLGNPGFSSSFTSASVRYKDSDKDYPVYVGRAAWYFNKPTREISFINEADAVQFKLKFL